MEKKAASESIILMRPMANALPSSPSPPPLHDQAITENYMISREFRSDPLIRSYSKALHKARCAARIVGFLHTLSTFLAYCSLTWASVLLLGVFASDLHFDDYSFITALLLFEATRLTSISFFTELLSHSQDPGHVNQAAGDDGIHHPHRARCFLSPLLQVLLIIPSFICAIIRLLATRFYNPGLINHLQMSLRIFYALIIVNAAVSSLHLFISVMAWKHLHEDIKDDPDDPKDLSIIKYYDEVLRNIHVNGVIQADNFNFFQFAFKYLGREHARCNGWKKVVEGHRKLLKYIYAHKQGADYLQICLDSEDASVRQAAANMVGMWADRERGVGIETTRLDLPPELLIKLADMVGTGEVGWAATNSFGALAKRNPQFLVQTLTSSEKPVLQRIAKLVNEYSTRSLAPVRTLLLFYNQIFLQRWQVQREVMVRPEGGTEAEVAEQRVRSLNHLLLTALPADIEAELVRKLKHLLKWSHVQRLRVQSAYLLYLLGKLDDDCQELITSIDPQQDDYWYEIEQKMLEFFLAAMPSYPSHVWSDNEVIYIEGPRPFA